MSLEDENYERIKRLVEGEHPEADQIRVYASGRRTGKTREAFEYLKEQMGEEERRVEVWDCMRCHLRQPVTPRDECERCGQPRQRPAANHGSIANGYGTGRKVAWRQAPEGYRKPEVHFRDFMVEGGRLQREPAFQKVTGNDPVMVEEFPCYDNGYFFIVDEVKNEEWSVYAWEEDGKVQRMDLPPFRRKYEAIRHADELLKNEEEDGLT